jgi:hypothetical protein
LVQDHHLKEDNDREEGRIQSQSDMESSLEKLASKQDEMDGDMTEPPIERESATSNNDVAKDNEHRIDCNELYQFQLRTKVLGLSIPSFTAELWKYLQIAGWTYVGGTYRPPNGKRGVWSDPLDIAKQIFRNVDATLEMREINTSDSEEGPEVFQSANDIVDYLDQYCLPDCSLTSFQVQQKRERLAKNSPAYERRCKRLRYELLEVAYRERSREHSVVTEKDGSMKSKYGHNHRPCDVCFEGASHMYPRVACHDCGLVVHTNCYGLHDYSVQRCRSSKKANAQNNREVDVKGFFQCDVCKVGLGRGSISKKTLWNAPQQARWREYSHPTAICKLCDYQLIAGGMIQITQDTSAGDRAGGTKRRRSRENQLETWVHIYCYNALTGKGYKQMTQNTDEVINRIGKSTSSDPGNVCCYCPKTDKSWITACKNKCGNHFHPICLQLEQSKDRSTNGKISICEKCSSNSCSDKSSDRRRLEVLKSSEIPSNNLSLKSGKAAHVQYFKQAKKKKNKTGETTKGEEVIVVPPIRNSIDESKKVYIAEQCEVGFDTFESQYSTQFREWAFALSIGQSILLYGNGSKRCVLESFGDALSTEGNVVALNGYDVNVSLTQFLDIMVEIVSQDNDNIAFDSSLDTANESESRREWVRKASFIADNYTDDRPLFLLIHNIDGEKLSSFCAQEAIAVLTAGSKKDGEPMIRIAATIDDVNRSMFWDPQTEHKFNWVWKLVHTYRPHFEEFKAGPEEISEKKTKKKRSIVKRSMSVKSVLTSLAPKHKDVVVLLANIQSRESIITYAELMKACIKNLIVPADSALRAILRELKDHKMVQYGTTGEFEYEKETVFIPDEEILHEILEFGS